MHKSKSWIAYCKAIKVNPFSEDIRNSEYYQKGFIEWKKINNNYHYFKYCLYNS